MNEDDGKKRNEKKTKKLAAKAKLGWVRDGCAADTARFCYDFCDLLSL